MLALAILLPVHVAISLVAIASGLVAMPALARGRWLPGWQALFLVTAALTSITGFLFPFGGVTPAFIFGVISMAAPAVAALALPRRAERRAAGIAFAVSATFALYLNLFVLIVQGFQKVAVLQPLAPTQAEWPFLLAQSLLLAGTLAVGALAVRQARRLAPVAAGAFQPGQG